MALVISNQPRTHDTYAFANWGDIYFDRLYSFQSKY